LLTMLWHIYRFIVSIKLSNSNHFNLGICTTQIKKRNSSFLLCFSVWLVYKCGFLWLTLPFVIGFISIFLKSLFQWDFFLFYWRVRNCFLRRVLFLSLSNSAHQ
jgi:hypothetical protein